MVSVNTATCGTQTDVVVPETGPMYQRDYWGIAWGERGKISKKLDILHATNLFRNRRRCKTVTVIHESPLALETPTPSPSREEPTPVELETEDPLANEMGVESCLGEGEQSSSTVKESAEVSLNDCIFVYDYSVLYQRKILQESPSEPDTISISAAARFLTSRGTNSKAREGNWRSSPRRIWCSCRWSLRGWEFFHLEGALWA